MVEIWISWIKPRFLPNRKIREIDFLRIRGENEDENKGFLTAFLRWNNVLRRESIGIWEGAEKLERIEPDGWEGRERKSLKFCANMVAWRETDFQFGNGFIRKRQRLKMGWISFIIISLNHLGFKTIQFWLSRRTK